MINFTLEDTFYYKEGEYKILEDTETNNSVVIKLATENNKAVVYLKDFTDNLANRGFRKVAEYENPTDSSLFFEDQMCYWTIWYMEYMNYSNLCDLLRSSEDCSFEYHYKHSYSYEAPRYAVTISLENGKIYFSVPNDNVKVFLTNQSSLVKGEKVMPEYLDMLIKKAAINYDIKYV